VPNELTDELADEFLTESMRLSQCLRRNGQRFCCEYHEGFEDALGIVQDWLANYV